MLWTITAAEVQAPADPVRSGSSGARNAGVLTTFAVHVKACARQLDRRWASASHNSRPSGCTTATSSHWGRDA